MGNYTSIIKIYCCNVNDDEQIDKIESFRFDENKEDLISEAATILPNAVFRK